jgi:two-component system, chemotaxis family, chemotaxis protein CheY
MMKRILIVDDSLIVRAHVASTLLRAGYDVIEAADGAEGCQKAESSVDLSMVICDVNMPVRSGLEMLAYLWEKGLTSRFPILMMTSELDPALMSQAKRLGAKGWMVKPVSPEALVATVRKLIG